METTETFLYPQTHAYPYAEIDIAESLYARFCRVRDEWQRVQAELDRELRNQEQEQEW